MSEVLLLNGPNLGTLGRRRPEIYGRTTLAEIQASVARELAAVDLRLIAVQEDGERELIHTLQRHEHTLGAIVNPGALMIAGYGLRDALESYQRPFIEVHLTNVWARESFRHHSVISDLATGVIAGLGAHGYVLAVQALIHRLKIDSEGRAKSA